LTLGGMPTVGDTMELPLYQSSEVLAEGNLARTSFIQEFEKLTDLQYNAKLVLT
jgi:hypothetical protein